MICDRVAILAKGQLKAIGPVSELMERETEHQVEIQVAGGTDALWEKVNRLGGAMRHQGELTLITVSGQRPAEELLGDIRLSNGRLVSFVPHKRSLEDLFLKETGKGVRE